MNEPSGHAAHASPTSPLYFPGEQAVHATKGLPSDPALHLQKVDASAERDPTGQLVHASGDSWYLPDAHAVHGPPGGPTYPELHVQLVTSRIPLAWTICEFDGHSVHTGYPPDTDHVASKPLFCWFTSLTNTICIYPVVDV